MPSTWDFQPKFRARALGWKSAKEAATRVRNAAKEIRKAAAIDPKHAAEGAVLLLEKIPRAFEEVDDSNGTLQTAIREARPMLVRAIATVEVPAEVRER